MRKLIIITVFGGLVLAVIGCGNKSEQRQYKVIEKDGLTVKGYVINDTIFDDTVSYYNSENIVVRKEVYVNGKVSGLSEGFYDNGGIRDRINYSNGLKNGVTIYYDSLGKKIYSDNYYYNLSVGPIVYYDTLGMAKRFFFVSFDNRTLLDIDYKSWKGIKDFVLNFINYSFQLQQADSVQEALLFLYIIRPPRFSTKYSLYKRSKKNDDDQDFITDLSSELPFIEYTLPILSNEYYYSIRLDIYDSVMNKRSIINREVW